MKGDRLWVWQEGEPDGSWGTIAAVIPALSSLGPALLVTRDETIAMTVFHEIADQHRERAARPVRLVSFTKESVHVCLEP